MPMSTKNITLPSLQPEIIVGDVGIFLHSINLLKYQATFTDLGYDTLDKILEIRDAQINVM